jgi:hypothetical protein
MRSLAGLPSQLGAYHERLETSILPLRLTRLTHKRSQGVVTVSIEVEHEPISLQLVCFPSLLTELAFRHVETLSVLECSVPVVSWPALIILKLYAGGPQDLLDVHQILKVRRPQAKDVQDIESMAQVAEVLSEWKDLWKKM